LANNEHTMNPEPLGPLERKNKRRIKNKSVFETTKETFLNITLGQGF